VTQPETEALVAARVGDAGVTGGRHGGGMTRQQTGLMVLRVWTEDGSTEPLRVDVRQTYDPQTGAGVLLAGVGPQGTRGECAPHRAPSQREEREQPLRALGDGDVDAAVRESEPAEQRDPRAT
jgi:hypothetical protein